MPAAIVDGQLYGDSYYVSLFGGSYYILDAATGALVLEADLNRTVPRRFQPIHSFFPILVSETHLFAGVDPGCITAFERDTGNYVWLHEVKGGSSFQKQTYFMSVNGRLFFADMGNRLYCYEAAEEPPAEKPLDAEGRLDFEVLEVAKNQRLTSNPPYHASRRGAGGSE